MTEPAKRIGRLDLGTMRPAILGYITIGMRGPRHPVKHDHLEICRVSRDRDDMLEPDVRLMRKLLDASKGSMTTCGACERSRELEKKTGVKFPEGLPRRLGVYLPSDDLDVVFPTRFAWHRGRRQFCTGDGRTALRYEERVVDGQPVFGARKPHGPCGTGCPDLAAGKCGPRGALNLILDGQEMLGGYYQWRTGSWSSLRAIEAAITDIQGLAGTARFVPLVFEIVEQRTQPADGSPAGRAWIGRLYYPGTLKALVSEAHATLSAVAPARADIRTFEREIKRRDEDPAPGEDDAIEAQFSTGPAEDFSQERVDPETGEVLEDLPVIQADGAAPAEGAAGPESTPFDPTPGELAREAARTNGSGAPVDLAATLTADQCDALVEALQRHGLGDGSRRMNFVRMTVKRQIEEYADLTQEEYAEICLQVGARPLPPTEAQLDLGATA